MMSGALHQMMLSNSDNLPLLLRASRYLTRRGLPGGYRLERLAEDCGLLNRVIRYGISDKIVLNVPLYRADNRWDRAEILSYEAKFVSLFCAALNHAPSTVHLIDCGADIGIFSLLSCSRAQNISRLTALEPNPEAFRILEQNLSHLPIAAEALAVAASNVSGKGELIAPHYDASDHARYLRMAAQGNVAVIRIDDLDLDPKDTLAIKIDTEGTELNVVQGSLRSIEQAAQVVVGFEVHRSVCRRTGIDPVEVVKAIQAVRPCAVSIAEAQGIALDLERPLLAQIPPSIRICNIVCRDMT